MRVTLFDGAVRQWLLVFGVLSLAACEPAPTPIGPIQTQSTGYTTKAICNAARTAPLASSCPLLTADPGCVAATCAGNLWYTIAYVINPRSIVSQACFPAPAPSPPPSEVWVFNCVQTAQCQCKSK